MGVNAVLSVEPAPGTGQAFIDSVVELVWDINKAAADSGVKPWGTPNLLTGMRVLEFSSSDRYFDTLSGDHDTYQWDRNQEVSDTAWEDIRTMINRIQQIPGCGAIYYYPDNLDMVPALRKDNGWEKFEVTPDRLAAIDEEWAQRATRVRPKAENPITRLWRQSKAQTTSPTNGNQGKGQVASNG